jgi:hypothetical protein
MDYSQKLSEICDELAKLKEGLNKLSHRVEWSQKDQNGIPVIGTSNVGAVVASNLIPVGSGQFDIVHIIKADDNSTHVVSASLCKFV